MSIVERVSELLITYYIRIKLYDLTFFQTDFNFLH